MASRSTQTPIPTAKSSAQLEEVATFGKGILPKILHSPDGSKIFLSDGSSVRILNASDYSEITSFTNPDDYYGYVDSISLDNSMMIIHGLGGGFHVVEIETQRIVARGGGFTSGMVFTPDKKYVIYSKNDLTTGGSYYSICRAAISTLSNDSEGNCYPPIYHEHNVTTDPAVSPNGRLIATGYSDNTHNILYILNLEEKTILHEIKEQPSRINGVAFSPDGSTLASVGDDGIIRLWNPTTGQLKRSISGFTNDLVGVEFSEDSQQLIVDVYEQPSVILRLDTGEQIPVTPEPPDPLTIQMEEDGYMLSGVESKVRFSPDRKTLAVGQGSIQIWDVSSQSLKTALFADQALNITGMIFSSDGNHLAVVSSDGDVYAWNTISGQQEFFVSATTLFDAQVLFAAGTSGIGPGIGTGIFGEQGIAFSPDASQLALPNGSAVELWDIQTATKVLALEQTDPVMFPTKITFSADGRLVYAALNRNRDLAVWNTQTGKLIRQLNLPPVDPNAFTAIEMYGQWFARNNYDEEDYWIEIWNAETGQMIKIPTHVREAEPFRFSANGRFLATILNHNQLFVWDVISAQLVFISEKIFDIDDFAISPQGDLLANTINGQVTLWNLEPYTELVSQPDFVPMTMPPTSTPWSSDSSNGDTPTSRPTPTPRPTLGGYLFTCSACVG